MDENDRGIGVLLKQIDLAFDRRMNNHLREQGLTRSQVLMLRSIELRGGEAPLKELQLDAGVAQSSAWGVAKRLEEKGLVELVTSSQDARAKVARITGAGREQCEVGRRLQEDTDVLLRSVYAPEEYDRLVGYLQRMLEAVTTENGAAEA